MERERKKEEACLDSFHLGLLLKEDKIKSTGVRRSKLKVFVSGVSYKFAVTCFSLLIVTLMSFVRANFQGSLGVHTLFSKKCAFLCA